MPACEECLRFLAPDEICDACGRCFKCCDCELYGDVYDEEDENA